jgi:hypothetical protein
MFDRLFGSDNSPRTLAISRLNLAEKGYNSDGSRRPFYYLGIGKDRSSDDYHAVLGGIKTTIYDGTERKPSKSSELWSKYKREKNLGYNKRKDEQGFKDLVQGQNADIAMVAFLGLAETITLRTLRKDPSKHATNEILRRKDPSNSNQLEKAIKTEYFLAGRPEPDPEYLKALIAGAQAPNDDREARFERPTLEEQQQEVRIKYEYFSHAKKIARYRKIDDAKRMRIENGMRNCVERAEKLWPNRPNNELDREKYLLEKLQHFDQIDREWEMQPAEASPQKLKNEYRKEQENRKRAIEKADETFFRDLKNDGALLNARYDGLDILVSRNNGSFPKGKQPEFEFMMGDFHHEIREMLMNVAVLASNMYVENLSVPLFLQWKPTDENINYLHPPNENAAFRAGVDHTLENADERNKKYLTVHSKSQDEKRKVYEAIKEPAVGLPPAEWYRLGKQRNGLFQVTCSSDKELHQVRLSREASELVDLLREKELPLAYEKSLKSLSGADGFNFYGRLERHTKLMISIKNDFAHKQPEENVPLRPQIKNPVLIAPKSGLRPNAPEFKPRSRLNPNAPEFKPKSRLNPNAPEFKPRLRLNPGPSNPSEPHPTQPYGFSVSHGTSLDRGAGGTQDAPYIAGLMVPPKSPAREGGRRRFSG